MKTNRFAFNVVGLIIAAFFAFAAVSTFFVVLPTIPQNAQRWWCLIATIEAIAAVALGIGGIVNLAKGRLALWSMAIMVLGYVVTVWLFPLAIWV